MPLLLPRLTNPKADSKLVLIEVDKKFASVGKKINNNIRFGFNNQIDYTSLDIVNILRDVFIYKLNCADWLNNISEQEIEQLIRLELKNIK